MGHETPRAREEGDTKDDEDMGHADRHRDEPGGAGGGPARGRHVTRHEQERRRGQGATGGASRHGDGSAHRAEQDDGGKHRGASKASRPHERRGQG